MSSRPPMITYYIYTTSIFTELSIMPSTNNSENQIASIQLPASLFEETAVLNSGVVGDGIGLVFTAYSSPVLFPLANGSRPSVEVRSSIIGALLGGLPVIRNLTDPIVIILEISLDDVSWDGSHIMRIYSMCT